LKNNKETMKKQSFTIPKNSMEQFQIEGQTVRGHEGVSLRVFRTSRNASEPIPTVKGVFIPIKKIKPILEALSALQENKKVTRVLRPE